MNEINKRAEAAAALGAAPRVVVPWSDELALVAFRQYQEKIVDKYKDRHSHRVRIC